MEPIKSGLPWAGWPYPSRKPGRSRRRIVSSPISRRSWFTRETSSLNQVSVGVDHVHGKSERVMCLLRTCLVSCQVWPFMTKVKEWEILITHFFNYPFMRWKWKQDLNPDHVKWWWTGEHENRIRGRERVEEEQFSEKEGLRDDCYSFIIFISPLFPSLQKMLIHSLSFSHYFN